jgi:hypothetical protein
MDQLRTALNWLQRYHFWALSVIVVAVAVGCWYSAAGALSQQFQANQAKIKSEFDNQRSLAGRPFHANEQINQRQQEEIKKQADSVLRTWDTLYKRQQDEVLQWPKEFDETFRKGVESLRFEDEISYNLREQYFNYIKNHFPALPKIVGARVLAGRKQGSQPDRRTFGAERFGREALGRSDSQEDAEDDQYLVEWLEQDQAKVRAELEWPKCPSSLEIWKVQEDLWVYQTLLQIVADTNEGADRRSNVAVRVIRSLEVGQEAAQASNSSGRIMIPQQGASNRGIPGMSESMGPMMGGGRDFGEVPIPSGMGGTMGGDMAGGGDERARLLSYRYLDKTGQPIAVAGPSAGPDEFGVEFKRLPVRMVLEMDQRAIPRLIANCTNQPLQVEVQQVRINPSGVGSSERDRSGFSSSSQSVQTFDAQPSIATVVIHGIIYIINQPNTSTLQIAEM